MNSIVSQIRTAQHHSVSSPKIFILLFVIKVVRTFCLLNDKAVNDLVQTSTLSSDCNRCPMSDAYPSALSMIRAFIGRAVLFCSMSSAHSPFDNLICAAFHAASLDLSSMPLTHSFVDGFIRASFDAARWFTLCTMLNAHASLDRKFCTSFRAAYVALRPMLIA